MSRFEHKSVLLEETREALKPKAGGLYVDCTLGAGGHSLAILEATGGKAKVVGIDRDDQAIEAARERISSAGYGETFIACQANFSDLAKILASQSLGKADGIIADLGFSSPQIDQADRGFSYLNDGPLDMRMDQSQDLDCMQLIADSDFEYLSKIFKLYGEERYAKPIAQAIIRARESERITTTGQLAGIIANAVPAKARRDKHPARKCFQALRIAVNGELDALESLLKAIPTCVNPGAIAGIISFHSLEDRLVKNAMKTWADPCKCPKQMPCNCGLKPLGKVLKDIKAGDREVKGNPRARSARLRLFEFGQDIDNLEEGLEVR